MSTGNHYVCDLDSMDWSVAQDFEANFRWEYDDGRESLLKLYRKGKRQQWDSDYRIDWSQDIDPENPAGLPDEMISIFGSPAWNRIDAKERTPPRHHIQAWQMSQFLHGEQGALVCAAKIVQQVPNIDAKFYGATQVMDEARHVEAFSRLLHEKYELVYPINPYLKSLIDDTLRDSRWDVTYLGMQVLIEGVALAAFGLIRDYAGNPLTKSVTAYVMQDEARHVAFGRLALRGHYPQLTAKERDEREEFVVEGCYLLRDRFLGDEVWEQMGLPMAECKEWVDHSELMRVYRTSLFARIVPTIKDIGLWGPRVRKAYADMGILGFADGDVEGMGLRDEEIARDLDARLKDISNTAAAAASAVMDWTTGFRHRRERARIAQRRSCRTGATDPVRARLARARVFVATPARAFRCARLPGRGARRARLRRQQQAARDRGLHAAEPGSDVVAVIDRLGDGSAIVFGHDWGAPISWTTALLHPDRVSAVALLSVPYIPLGEVVVHRHDEGHVPGPLLLPALFPAGGRRRGGTRRRPAHLAAQGLFRVVGLGAGRASGRHASRRTRGCSTG